MRKEFEAVIKQHGNINGAYVEIPFNIEEVFGAKRVKVKATFDGFEYRGSIVYMGGICMIGITGQIRKAIGKDFGDMITVTVEKDEEERTIEIPEDFQSVLNHEPAAQEFFQNLSFTNRKKFCDWINSAKKAETRLERIQKAIVMLRDNTKL